MPENYWTPPFYFKFPDEETAIKVVRQAQETDPDINLYSDEHGWSTSSHDHQLDLDVPVTDANSEREPGFFVNAKFAIRRREAFQPLIATALASGFMELKHPITPYRKL